MSVGFTLIICNFNIDLYSRGQSLIRCCEISLIHNLSIVFPSPFDFELMCLSFVSFFFDHETNGRVIYLFFFRRTHCCLSLCQDPFYLQHSKRCPLANTLQTKGKISISESMYLLLDVEMRFNLTQTNKFLYLLCMSFVQKYLATSIIHQIICKKLNLNIV